MITQIQPILENRKKSLLKERKCNDNGVSLEEHQYGNWVNE